MKKLIVIVLLLLGVALADSGAQVFGGYDTQEQVVFGVELATALTTDSDVLFGAQFTPSLDGIELQGGIRAQIAEVEDANPYVSLRIGAYNPFSEIFSAPDWSASFGLGFEGDNASTLELLVRFASNDNFQSMSTGFGARVGVGLGR